MDDPKTAVLRLHIHKVLYRRSLETQEGRREAIRELLAALRPDLAPEKAACVAEAVPALLPEMHRKWIGLFVDRLFETAAPPQLEILCDGSEENNGALALAYVMFLESERMEKVIAQDLQTIGRLDDDEMAGAVASLCSKLSQIEESLLKARQAKAGQYQREKN